MRFVRLLWITTIPGRAWVGSVSDKHNPSTKSGLGACISSRITTVIHVVNDHQINYNCFNEPFAVSPYRSLYWDMHGLIFETSIWLLAGSTRFVRCYWDTYSPMGPWCYMAQQQKCIYSQLTNNAWKQAMPSKKNSQPDASKLHFNTVSMTMLKQKPPAHTQHAVCHQAVAQYPESFNDHKETHWQAP